MLTPVIGIAGTAVYPYWNGFRLWMPLLALVLSVLRLAGELRPVSRVKQARMQARADLRFAHARRTDLTA